MDDLLLIVKDFFEKAPNWERISRQARTPNLPRVFITLNYKSHQKPNTSRLTLQPTRGRLLPKEAPHSFSRHVWYPLE